MITAENEAVKVGLIRAGAWSDAVAAYPQLRVDDELLMLEWQSAGIISPAGEADPAWETALRVVREAVIGTEIVSLYNSVMFSATMFVKDAEAVCVTARATVGESGSIDAVHPMLEVALGPSSNPWLLIQRVLPPLDQLRASPKPARPDQVTPVRLEGVEIPEAMRASEENFAKHLTLLPNLPAPVADAIDPLASVFAFSLRGDNGGVTTSSWAWALGHQGIYRIDTTRGGVAQVPPGDLGHHLVASLR